MLIRVSWGDERADRMGARTFTSIRRAKQYAHRKRMELRLPIPDASEGKFRNILRMQGAPEDYTDAYVCMQEPFAR